MRRAVLSIGWAALVAATVTASPEVRTISGEVVDVRCFETTPDNAGDAHVDCALSCARRGATLGIRTTDGVYVITGEFTTEANRRLIEFVARTVDATGEVATRDRRQTIRLKAIKIKAP